MVVFIGTSFNIQELTLFHTGWLPTFNQHLDAHDQTDSTTFAVFTTSSAAFLGSTSRLFSALVSKEKSFRLYGDSSLYVRGLQGAATS
jgi:hypothetical protein